MENPRTASFLDGCTALLDRNVERIAALAAVAADTANRPPPGGGWSVAQCLDHAVLAIELYLPHMEAALARAPVIAGRTTSARGTWLGRLIANALDPAPGRFRRLRAPQVFMPSATTIEWERLHRRAADAHTRLRTFLAVGASRDLDRIRHRTPVSRFVRVSIAQAIHIHTIHVARHLDQAERSLGER